MSVLAASPMTGDALRERIEALALDLDAALTPYDEPSTRDLRNDPVSRKRRVNARDRWFERVRSEILGLARDPAWRDHALMIELLLTHEDLRAEIALDPDALDPEWKVRYVMKIMRVVVAAMLRQLDHEAIDDPVVAAKLVADELRNVEVGEVARLLGTTRKSIRNWRGGRIDQIKRNPDRIVLVGQLVYELRNSTTGHGILLWFDAPREQFGGRTPRRAHGCRRGGRCSEAAAPGARWACPDGPLGRPRSPAAGSGTDTYRRRRPRRLAGARERAAPRRLPRRAVAERGARRRRRGQPDAVRRAHRAPRQGPAAA